jgi:hypothetical protein
MVLLPRSSDPISRVWRQFQRHRAIRRYLKILPSRLFKDYGHRGPFTPAQVEAANRRYKISSPQYEEYAIALFSDPDQLRQTNPGDVWGPNYEAVRGDLATSYFGGDPDFTWRDAYRISSDHGGGEHSAHHGGEVHSYHGGEGGGHH